MASSWYNSGKRDVLNGTIKLSSDTIKLMLVDDNYTPNVNHDFVNDVNNRELSGTGYVGGFNGSGRQTLSGKVFSTDPDNDRAEFTANDLVWSDIDAGIARYGILIKEVTDDTDSRLIAWLDLSGLGITTNGQDLFLSANDIDGILQIKTSTTPVAVPIDNGIYFPETAAQWNELGLPAPDALWLCQESSGNLVDVINGYVLTAAGTPTYQQSLGGSFARKGVGLTAGTSQQFGNSAGIFPIGATDSIMIYTVLTFSAGANNRQILHFAPGVEGRIRHTLTERLDSSLNGNLVGTGSVDHSGAAFGLVYSLNKDPAVEENVIETSLESIPLTYDGGALTGDLFALGADTSEIAMSGVIAMVAVWYQGNAEFDPTSVLSYTGWI